MEFLLVPFLVAAKLAMLRYLTTPSLTRSTGFASKPMKEQPMPLVNFPYAWLNAIELTSVLQWLTLSIRETKYRASHIKASPFYRTTVCLLFLRTWP